MAVFVLHPADHVGHFVKRAETGWPVGNGQPCVVTGDESAGNDKNKRDAGGEDSKAVQSTMVRDFDALQNAPQGNGPSPRTFPKRTSLADGRLGSPTLMDFIPIKTPSSRVTGARKTLEFFYRSFGVGFNGLL
jgi:hypothetical protein